MVGSLPAPTTRRLGPYAVGRRLGSGGMATVFAARQEGAHAKRLVALKILTRPIVPDDVEHNRFLREAQVAARLEHPNIVRTYDVGEIDGRLYLAMELLHGASLFEWAARANGPAPIAVAVKIVHDVARALHAAHELSDPVTGHLGVVHQDVSPANIVVGYDGIVKLLDFGVARLAAVEGTHTKTIAGKPAYLSPEQVHGQHIDRRCDLFALGTVFWELLAGRRLFKKDTEARTYIAVLQDPIPDIGTINPEVPRSIGSVVMKALERDPAKRYATAEELRKALVAGRMGASVPDLGDEDLARFIQAGVPESITPADLEREIVTLANRPLAISEHPVETEVEHTEVNPDIVPDLGLPPPRAAASSPALPPPPVTSPPQGSVPDFDLVVPPPSKSGAFAPARTSSSPVISHGVAQDDEDDFDMHIERNIAGSLLPAATSSRSMPAGRTSGAHRTASTGLEVAHVRASSRAAVEDDEDLPGIGMRIVGFAVAGVFLAGAGGALVRFAHRSGGFTPTKVLPHAFDGTSAPESGVVALTALALAVALGFGGIKSTPRSWSWVASATAMMLLALAMVTVTLASTGENPEPPDGALLVPYLLPAALLFFGLGLGGRAAWLFAQRGALRKLGAIPVAAIAGALCFAAYEASKLAH